MLRSAFGTAIALATLSPALAGEVAVTIDDLPIYGGERPIGEARALTRKLLAGLERHHVPATGFVNEVQLDTPDRPARIGLLRRWVDAGMDLGNHSYSHLSLSETPLEAYIADVARGDAVTRTLMAARGKSERWYRYPYLETGRTPAIHEAFEAWLGAHGYRTAPVTMETDDWQFADAYDQARAAHDRKRARAVRTAYLAYSAKAMAWYREASMALLGREVRFVLLIHASRLNADSIGALARSLGGQGLKPVTLDEAMADPAYKLSDTAFDPNGDEWLTRWSQALHRDLPYRDLPAVPADIAGDNSR